MGKRYSKNKLHCYQSNFCKRTLLGASVDDDWARPYKPPQSMETFQRPPSAGPEHNREKLSDRALEISKPFLYALLLTKRSVKEDEVFKMLDAQKSRDAHDSIKRALKDTGDTYITWRYLFQSIRGTKDDKIVLLYWAHLHCLCRTLDKLAENTLKREQRQG